MGLRVGPFTVEEKAGAGAMGEVWRARHVASGRIVAIKVLTHQRARTERGRRAFVEEVRAAAGLDHPSVVEVLDLGWVEPGSALPSGSPWMAMEWASNGTLATRTGMMAWEAIARTLGEILDALAHAHARGVVHRDVKPSNVLVAGDGCRLADFGIAFATGRRVVAGAGTPAYLAPEQLDGTPAGPWTDLYAVGCLATALVQGTPPFVVSSLAAAAVAHRSAAPPLLAPRMAIPEGLRDWISGLLQKEPAARPAGAADAAVALRALGPPGTRGASGLPIALADETHTRGRARPPRTVLRPAPPVPRMPAAPMPEGWREPLRARPRLTDGGTALVGLRAVPFVGRERERELLWTRLREVRDAGRPRGVLLRGPSGCGKSRLAEWLHQRATQTGAAHGLAAWHGPQNGPGEGLGPMFARALWCDAPGTLAIRLRARGLDAWDARRMADAASGRTSPTETLALYTRALACLAADRPVVVWLDDLQWGAEALAFAHHLLQSSVPVLVVATAREEFAERTPLEGVPVGPLTPDEAGRFVRSLATLEPTLSSRVHARAAGNPLFALHLVTDWIHRDLLVPGPDGLRPRDGAVLSLPDDLHDAARARIDQALSGRPVAARTALELLAALGPEVPAREWRQACRLAGVSFGRDLVDHLLDAGLIRAHGRGVAFTHAMLREAVLRGAGASTAARHAICARVTGPGERLARHLHAAGEHAAAAPALLAAADARADVNDFPGAVALLEEREEALATIALDPADEDWGRGWVAMFQSLYRHGLIDRAEAWMSRAEDASGAHGWDATRLAVLLQQALLRTQRGDHAGAMERLAQARAGVERLGDPSSRGEWLRASAWPLLRLGRGEEADAALRQAAIAYTEANDPGHRMMIAVSRAIVLSKMDRRSDAEVQARAALRLARALRRPLAEAEAANCLGEIARARGRLRTARRCYERAVILYQRAGAHDVLLPMANLGIVELALGRTREARPVLEAARGELQRLGKHMIEAIVRVYLLQCADGRDEFEAHLGAAEAFFGRSGMADLEVADALAIAAARSPWPELAARARVLEREQRARLG